MSYRVRVSITGEDEQSGEMFDNVVVERWIYSDSHQENADDWARIMDGAVNLVYGYDLPFTIKSVWSDEEL